MNTTYDVDYFIAKFSAIPDERWTTGVTNIYSDGPRCALGHCNSVYDARCASEEGLALARILLTVWIGRPLSEYDVTAAVWYLNDGFASYYNCQLPPRAHGPKARILAALHDIKSKAEQAMDDYETRPLIKSTRELVR